MRSSEAVGARPVGCDLVEVAPIYDVSGMTSRVAPDLLYEMLCVLPGVERRTHEPLHESEPLMVDYLTLERSDGVATITIDRPEVRNAITAPGWTGLHDLFDEVARDDSVRVLVITGAGEDFCSGADVGGDPRDREGHPLDGMRSVGRACQTLHTLPKPTIARVDGVAAGAGLNMALACDFVLASDRSRFSEIFARRGLNIDFGGSFILPRIVGMQKAKELVLGRHSRRRTEMGLVNRGAWSEPTPSSRSLSQAQGWATDCARH